MIGGIEDAPQSQISFSDAAYAGRRQKSRREVLLQEMALVVPWKVLFKIIEPRRPVAGRGRTPYPLESMLWVYLAQNWFALSDPAMVEAFYEMASLRSLKRPQDARPKTRFSVTRRFNTPGIRA